MDDVAGISLRPGMGLLVTMDGWEPVVAARVAGYASRGESREEVPRDHPPRGLSGLLHRITGGRHDTDNARSAPYVFSEDMLRELRNSAAGRTIARVVIAVPAHANDAERKSVADAAAAVGWDVLRLMNEPMASAFAMTPLYDGDRKILVYDLSSTRFDVSIIGVRDGAPEILACNGLTEMDFGGDLAAALEAAVKPCEAALQDARLQPAQIDVIVAAGEATRDPRVAMHLERVFGIAPTAAFDPEEVAAIGAAVQAKILSK